ncbi:hypothetical protein GBA52_020845 [Prunus armeniaca]|nr:hypothetical protein GBA52_020845 [Prunus armeniaca]
MTSRRIYPRSWRDPRPYSLGHVQNIALLMRTQQACARAHPSLWLHSNGSFGWICSTIGSELDDIALCARLESLLIKNSADLTNMGLIEIARGCCKSLPPHP